MTPEDELSTIKAALADGLCAAQAYASELKSALGERLPHKHAGAQRDIDIQLRGAEALSRLVERLEAAEHEASDMLAALTTIHNSTDLEMADGDLARELAAGFVLAAMKATP